MAANLEPSAISKLREWKQEQMALIKEREDALSPLLRAAVPEGLAVWFKGHGESVIKNLLTDGVSTGIYRTDVNGLKIYGYTNLREFALQFETLRLAWSGVVDIRIDWQADDYRFEITFTAI